MQWNARPELAVGDHILTPFGVARVTDFDHPRDGIVTTHGSWGLDEIEAIPAPDTSDPDQVEAWLGLAARIIPKTQVESVHVPCPCDCEHCYRVDQYRTHDRTRVMVQPFNTFHFRNNEVCRCARELCPCL